MQLEQLTTSNCIGLVTLRQSIFRLMYSTTTQTLYGLRKHRDLTAGFLFRTISYSDEKNVYVAKVRGRTTLTVIASCNTTHDFD